MDLFNSSFFQSNRDRLSSTVDADLIVLTAGARLQRSGDTTYPFRQDSNFWYLSGINEPECVLVIDKNSDDTFVILPETSEHEAIFNGSPKEAELSEESGIASLMENSSGWKKLTEISKGKKIGTLSVPPPYISDLKFYTNPARYFLHKKLQDLGATIIEINEPMMRLRMIKQDPELNALRLAVNVTVRTLNEDVFPLMNSASSEHEIMSRINFGFDKRGATGHGYEPIVAGGGNACVLHYIDNNRIIKEGEMVLIDVGAEITMYSADITRVYPKGKVSDRQKQVYESVYKIQQTVFNSINPESTLRTLDQVARSACLLELKSLGLSADDDSQLLNRYFPHSIGHYIGLDVHDAGDHDTKLKTGMVFTVEPGIYIKEENIGVRIEDDILITNDGFEVLSKDLSSSLSSVFGN